METLNIDVPLFSQVPAQGISHPLPVIASDGNTYILKNQNSRDDSKDLDAMFFQEALSTQLAQKLNIPVPDWAIIEIDNQTLLNFPELQFQYKFEPGKYYATRRIENVANDLVALLNEEIMCKTRGAAIKLHNIFNKISNKNDIPSIILFDFWVSNVDRFTNSGNLILRIDGKGNYIIAIDFSHCFFGPFWDKTKQSDFLEIINAVKMSKVRQLSANLTNLYLNLSRDTGQLQWKLGLVFDELQKQIVFNNKNPFKQAMFKINNISNRQIASMMDKIPANWIVGGADQKALYLNYLNAQKSILPDLMQYQAEQQLYTNFKGGTLEWRKEKNINIQ
ncbi:HipA family kinase [Limosilactobacillus galli]|uniref:HipA family kinase n=1 Tax=Limosilactobacillus galli TaxID=2991834 RepID=UPI0024BBE924|nr:HipA family kinase [Limosilactobacillus galli]